MMFDPDMSDEANDANEVSDAYPADRHQHLGTSTSTTHPGYQLKLTIISSTGIFKHWIRWCHCSKSLDQYVQLLLCGKLFPAGIKNPKTAFTFEVLDHF